MKYLQNAWIALYTLSILVVVGAVVYTIVRSRRSTVPSSSAPNLRIGTAAAELLPSQSGPMAGLL
jgi:hypothetical protein